jgi:hypothetical protein
MTSNISISLKGSGLQVPMATNKNYMPTAWKSVSVRMSGLGVKQQTHHVNCLDLHEVLDRGQVNASPDYFRLEPRIFRSVVPVRLTFLITDPVSKVDKHDHASRWSGVDRRDAAGISRDHRM